jgi:hypothetical protein
MTDYQLEALKEWVRAEAKRAVGECGPIPAVNQPDLDRQEREAETRLDKAFHWENWDD